MYIGKATQLLTKQRSKGLDHPPLMLTPTAEPMAR
jgi:hypothetical protein